MGIILCQKPRTMLSRFEIQIDFGLLTVSPMRGHEGVANRGRASQPRRLERCNEHMLMGLRSLAEDVGISNLTDVAADDAIFIKQRNDQTYDHLSWRKVTYNIHSVDAALDLLSYRQTSSTPQHELTTLDEKTCDNLEHLLLRIRHSLEQALSNKVVALIQAEANDWNSHRKHQLKFGGEKWCSEYSSSRRPLSTTWPWSIRPSLAVLWGVCWMFYPQEGGENSKYWPYAPFIPETSQYHGESRAAEVSRRLGASDIISRDSPCTDHTFHQQNSAFPSTSFGLRNFPGFQANHNHNLNLVSSDFHRFPVAQGFEPNPLGIAGPSGFAAPGLGYIRDVDASTIREQLEIFGSPPQYSGFGAQRPLSHPSDLTWHHTPATLPVPRSRSRDLSSFGLTPNRGVTGPNLWDSASPHQPAFAYNYQALLSGPEANPPLLPANSTIPYNYQYQVNMSDHEVSRLERSPGALRDAADIPTDPALENPHPDHVHHQDHLPIHHHIPHHQDPHQLSDQMHHHDEMGDDMSSPDNQEPFSPRRGYTHKRNEDPPRNNQGKMMCKFQSTCSSLTFDRRCEWSKHMDKHDRPYKCLEPGCEKLQGFTYSGGLLRHQREVHKMHGGTKKALYCPEPNCKRNSGSGFTRKENLSEHIRRVHRRATDGTEIAVQAQNGLDQLEAAAAAQQIVEDDGMATDGTERSNKRKRDDAYFPTNGDDVHGGAEFALENDAVKRLRNENQDLKDRMRAMEESMAKQQVMVQELLNRQGPVAPQASMYPGEESLSHEEQQVQQYLASRQASG